MPHITYIFYCDISDIRHYVSNNIAILKSRSISKITMVNYETSETYLLCTAWLIMFAIRKRMVLDVRFS